MNKNNKQPFSYFIIITFLVLGMLPFFAFGKQKVLDLGAIEIKGEIRRPNVKLVHSKKYFNKAVSVVAKEELKEFEKELLKPIQLDSIQLDPMPKKGKSQ